MLSGLHGHVYCSELAGVRWTQTTSLDPKEFLRKKLSGIVS